MKPTNRIYIGGPALDPPDEELLHRCPHCQRLNTQDDYRPDGECPQCQTPYNGSEED